MTNTKKRSLLFISAILCAISIVMIWTSYDIVAYSLQAVAFGIMLYVEYMTRKTFKLDLVLIFLLAGFGLNIGFLLGGIFRAITTT